MERVAVLMLGRVLTDASLLGADVDTYRRALFRSGDRNAVATIADGVASLVGGQRGSGARRREVQAVLDFANGDPLAVIRLVVERAHLLHEASPYFPVDMFGLEDVRASYHMLPTQLADSHLHSGASMSMGAFCDLMVRSALELSDEAHTLLVHDIGWRPVRVGVVAAAVRTFIYWRLHDAGLAQDFMKPICRTLLSNGLFWEHVKDSAIVAVDPELWPELRTSAGAVDFEQPFADVVVDILRDAQGRGSLAERRNCLGLFAGLAMLNRYLRSQPGEGLSRFVDRFEEMGLARDLLLSDGRAELVTAACRASLASNAVVGAEFRKTFVGAPGEAAENRIRTSLQQHLLGMEAFTGEYRRDLQLSMPVGFLRQPNSLEPDSGTLASIVGLEEVWAIGQSLARLRSESRTAREFIPSVDVAGDEVSTPSWPFVLLFDGMRRMGGCDDLVWSAHAGESFEWTLQGVRNVGEFVLPTLVVDRIGHGLALDAECSEQIAGEPPETFPARAVLDDLVWLIEAQVQVGEAKDMLDRVLAAIGLDATGLSVEDIIEGGRLRRSIDGFVRAGLTVHAPTSTIGVPPNIVDEVMLRTDDRSARAMILLVYRGQGAASVMDRSLRGALRDTYAEWSASVADEARARVVEAIRSRGVIVEACPTSNLRLAGLSSYRLLPLRRWYDAGLRVSLNSDDPINFGRSVADEALTVMQKFGEEVLRAMADCSIQTCSGGTPRRSEAAFAEGARAL